MTMMCVEVDDSKVHLNFNIDADNTRCTLNEMNNRVGIDCHFLAFS